jgi:hypothetical protein
MDESELARIVSAMARGGSVQAAKLRWEMLRAPQGSASEPDEDERLADPLAELDELAQRRRSVG